MGWPYRQFQPCMRLPASGRIAVPRTPMGGSRQREKSICFLCYYYCLCQLSFQRHSTSSFRASIAWGDSLFVWSPIMHQWLASPTMSLSWDILDKSAWPGILHHRQLPKPGWCTSFSDKWLIKRDFWSARVKAQVVPGDRSIISSCSSWMTLLSFTSIICAGRINFLSQHCYCYFPNWVLPSLRRWGFSLFLICTMLIIQGYFTVGIKLCCFSVLGVSFYKEGPATTLEFGDYFWPVAFYGDTSISSPRGLLECPDCLIGNADRSDVGVVCFTGNDAKYAENQQAQSSRNNPQNVDSEIGVSPSGSNSIGD